MTVPAGTVGWPADLANAYRVAGLWSGRPLGSQVWQWAHRWGARVAVVDGPLRLTYHDLAVRTDALAEGMAGHGLGRGDTILVQLPNQAELILVTLACFRLGVAPVMMLAPHREYELSAIGSHVDARALVVPDEWRGYDHHALAQRVAAALPPPVQILVVGERVRSGAIDVRELARPDGDIDARRHRLDQRAPDGADVALFLLSGGTTGVPKVITRTHDDYGYNIRCCVRVCDFGPDTVYLAVLPVAHNFALACPGVLGTLHAGGRVVLAASPAPEVAFAAIESERVTATSAVPAVLARWVSALAGGGRDLSSLRYVHVGGSMLAPEVAAATATALDVRLQQVYGMAEGLICYTPADAPDEVAHATQGAPVSPYDELLVVDGDGEAVPAGEVGELLTRGPYTPRGYFRAPEQNSLSYTSDGWYRTGDLVRVTREGNVVVCGRVKDLINRGGEKVSAAEIETLAQELSQVAEAAAVGVSDPRLGERVCLFVRLAPGATLTLDEVRAALTARGVAAFKLPERLEVLRDLPHTPIGKPDKKRLRQLLAMS